MSVVESGGGRNDEDENRLMIPWWKIVCRDEIVTATSNQNKTAEDLYPRRFENGISTTSEVATCDVKGGYYEICTTCNDNVTVSKIYWKSR